jgi:tyrosine-protein phosphatase YwqE
LHCLGIKHLKVNKYLQQTRLFTALYQLVPACCVFVLVAAAIAGIFGETRFMYKTSFYLLLIFLPFAGAAQKKRVPRPGMKR